MWQRIFFTVYFNNIKYDNLTLLVEGLNETMYELDENEVVDYDTPIVLKISTDKIINFRINCKWLELNG